MKKKVMIVDDSRFIFEEMKFMLEDSVFEVVAYAQSGEDALSQFESAAPDIVTMDIVLPGIDGMETAEMILKKWPETRVVMISSLAYDETEERAHSIGAADFLFKPFEKEQLIDALNKACA